MEDVGRAPRRMNMLDKSVTKMGPMQQIGLSRARVPEPQSRSRGNGAGEMAEAKFLAKASELGFGVAKPWGDSDAYDFVQTGGRLWVQVKSAHVAWKWEL